MTPAELRAFEDRMALAFADGKIAAPLHLSHGNEEQLIEIFDQIEPEDWVLVGWRSHYHCLLKGVPERELEAAILAGHSVSLCFPKHRILCSGIVGGIAPIATGLAWQIRAAGHRERRFRVHCFVGDMTAETGIFAESVKYAANFGLPVRFIVEDNGKSVMTETKDAWGLDWPAAVMRYNYTLGRPHVGIGKRVEF